MPCMRRACKAYPRHRGRTGTVSYTHLKAAALNSSREEAQEFLNKQIETRRKQLAAGKDSGSINDERRRELMLTARILEEMSAKIADKADGNAAFETVKEISVSYTHLPQPRAISAL